MPMLLGSDVSMLSSCLHHFHVALGTAHKAPALPRSDVNMSQTPNWVKFDPDFGLGLDLCPSLLFLGKVIRLALEQGPPILLKLKEFLEF